MKWIKMAYELACMLGLIYYSSIQAERFFENADMSTVTVKTFNERQQDQYPDITFCIEGGHFGNAIKELNVSADTISNILKGENLSSVNVSPRQVQIIQNLYKDMWYTDLTRHVLSCSFRNDFNVALFIVIPIC